MGAFLQALPGASPRRGLPKTRERNDITKSKNPPGGVGGRRPPLPWALGLPPGSRNRHPLFRVPTSHGHSVFEPWGGVPKPERGGGWEQPDTPCQPPPAKSGVGSLDLAYFQRENKAGGAKLRGGGAVCVHKAFGGPFPESGGAAGGGAKAPRVQNVQEGGSGGAPSVEEALARLLPAARRAPHLPVLHAVHLAALLGLAPRPPAGTGDSHTGGTRAGERGQGGARQQWLTWARPVAWVVAGWG